MSVFLSLYQSGVAASFCADEKNDSVYEEWACFEKSAPKDTTDSG